MCISWPWRRPSTIFEVFLFLPNFVCSCFSRQARRKLTTQELRRAARRPWKRCGKGVFPSSSNLPSSNPSSYLYPSSSNNQGGSIAGGVPSSSQVNAAAALAGLTGQLSSSNPAMAAVILQQQLLAQNLLSPNNFGGGANFLSSLTSNSASAGSNKTYR